MSDADNNERQKKTPSHSVSFSRITGQDREGNDILGPARPIGAIWERKGKEGEGILRFDHIPEELRQHGGVVFVSKLHARIDPKAPARDGDRDGGRDRNRGRDGDR